MRRFLLVTTAVILGSIAAFAGYVMWDYDPDNVSPMVTAPSYMDIFDKAVRDRSGNQAYASLDPQRKSRVLGDLLAMRGNEPAREVALFMLRELPDKDAALGLLRKYLEGLRDEQYEVAVGSVRTLGTPKSMALLDSLYRRLSTDPAASTPLGDYRTSTLVARRDGANLAIRFEELSRTTADYRQAQTRQMALFFPAGPEYVVAIPNADDVLDDLYGSKCMKALDGSPVPHDAWSLPMLKTLASLRARLDETMGFLAPYFAPERFFRDGVMLAKYRDSYLIASYKDKNVAVAEGLIDVFSKLGKDFGIRHWQVDGTTIASVRNLKSGRTLNYAVDGDYFLVGTDTAVISSAIRTYHSEKENSIAIDPLFANSFNQVDPTGAREVFYAWFNPTTAFAITGSASTSARRLAVVARALGRTTTDSADVARARMAADAAPGVIGSTTMSGSDPVALWRYIVNVRSLGKNPIDSLARLAKMDLGKQVMPYLGPALSIGYAGVDHMKRQYGYSNTAFNLVAAVPLRSIPPRFDSTLRIFFGRVTSLVYTPEMIPGTSTRLWIASDTTTNDSLLRARKLQPSFGIVNGVLIIGSTPSLLRSTAAAFSRMAPSGSANAAYFLGTVHVDAFGDNAARYIKSYLMQRDMYSPGEIGARIDPLRTALSSFSELQWTFQVDNGLRRGDARLIARQ